MLAWVWARLRDRLSAVDSLLSMVDVTEDYAAHVYVVFTICISTSIRGLKIFDWDRRQGPNSAAIAALSSSYRSGSHRAV